jgi:hypothetical protein
LNNNFRDDSFGFETLENSILKVNLAGGGIRENKKGRAQD